MKRLIAKLPAPIAAPLIGLAVLIGAFIGLLLTAVVMAAGLVSAVAGAVTLFNLAGFVLTGSAAAGAAALKTGAMFCVAFSVPILLGSTASRLWRGRKPRDAAFAG